MCKNVINAFNVVHLTVQLAFFVEKSLTCKKQISPLIRFLKVQVSVYAEATGAISQGYAFRKYVVQPL